MERIAPLAKILAEANGIEWQNLPGTGAGGQIVEQDILDYLSRVMSGEAEPPSTPVDAPPPDWNGEDVPGAGMFDVSALSRAGVDSDITDFVQQGRPAGAQAAAPQVPGTPAPALASDDFELEDAPEVPANRPAAPAPSSQTPSGQTQPTQPSPVQAPAAGGLGSLLSRLYHKEETPAPAVSMPEVAAPSFTAPQVKTPEVAAPEVQAPAPSLTVPAAPAMAEPAATAPAFTAPVMAPAEDRIAVPVAPVMPAAPAAAEPAPARADVPRDAVWFGTYLRRNADVTQLTELRGQLNEALEQDVPLALLVARAAQRHADLLGVSRVAIQDVHAGEARSVGEGSLREALQASGSTFGGQPDLLVVDAGTLDLDELHYPHTATLSVGRVDGGRAGLSLQGDVDQARAAQFLAAVAQTLEKPVILLV